MKLPRISSLYGRIFAIFWLTMLLVLIAVLLLPRLDPRQMRDMPSQPLARLQQTAQQMSNEFGQAHSITQAIRSIEQQYQHQGNLYFYFTTNDGEWLSQPNGLRRKVLINFITQNRQSDQVQQKLYGRTMVAGPINLRLANQEVLLYTTMRWERSPPFLFQLMDRPIQLLLAVMLVSTPLLLWLAWALSQPAMRLQKAAQKVARGQFEIDPELEKGTSEFKQAGASFNQMVLAVNNMISGQQRLLSDISHELRSPLTRLRMANALAIRKQGTSSELTRIDTEAERLELMISELLSLSRQQVNSHQTQEQISAQQLWGDLIDDAIFEAEQVGKVLHCQALPDCTLTGNANLLTSALENVVRNAISYSDKQIWLTTSKDKHNLTLVIEDDGDGVEEHELEAIFRPFYRVSTARDRHSGGTGLGLSITEVAVRQHSGSIQASISQYGGLAITMRLPISN